MHNLVKNLFDIGLSFILIVILIVPMLIIAIMVKITSRESPIYWSLRIGRNGKLFKMPKFRSMSIKAPEVATHLMSNPDEFMSSTGKFLRRTSLDEVPQLFSILKGDMSLVGPRPALFNQEDLILLRSSKGIDKILPGLTGWAQVNGRDDLSISEKVALDEEYMQKKSLMFDFKILWMTLLKVFNKKGISH